MHTVKTSQVYGEQVKQLYAIESVGLVGTMVNSSILCFVQRNVISHHILLAWLAILSAVTLLRFLLLRGYQKPPVEESRPGRWGALFIAGAACSAERTSTLVATNERLAQEIEVRGRAEEALRENEQRYRELADLLPQPIFESDLNGRLTFANRTASNSLGYTPQDIQGGLDIYQMIVPEDRDRARATTRRRRAGESIKNVEYTAQRKDNISLIRRNTSPADAFFQLLQQAETACFRAKDLTQQLLTFSRGGEPVKKVIDVAAPIRDSVAFALKPYEIEELARTVREVLETE